MIPFNKFYLTEVGNASGHFDRPKNGPDILAIGQPLGKLHGAGGFKGAAQIGVPDDLTIFVPNPNKNQINNTNTISNSDTNSITDSNTNTNTNTN